MNNIVLPALFAAALIPLRLEAQDSLAAQRAPHMCFRGRPLPICSGFWLTEFGVAARVASNDSFASSALMSWELGLMTNRNTRSAIGAAFFVEGLDEYGFRPRYRRWLNPRIALDLAPGIILKYSRHRVPAFSGQVALNFSDYFAFTSTLRVARQSVTVVENAGSSGVPTYTQTWQTSTAWYAGGRLGALPGTIVGIAVPTVVIVALLIICGGGQCFD